MRLLFLTETVPFPPDSGGRIKTFNTLRMLASEHHVHLHALVRDNDRLRGKPALEAICSSVELHYQPRSTRSALISALAAAATGRPLTVQRHFHMSVLRRIRASMSQRFDAVYCDHLSMFEYGKRLSLPVILDAHNVEFEIIRRHAATVGIHPLRLLYAREWRAVRRYERRAYPDCQLIFVVSDVDAEGVRTLGAPAANIATLPISIDTAAMPVPGPLTEATEMLFVGGLRWPPNADGVQHFVSDILPLIRQELPTARLTIVGEIPGAIRERLRGTAGVEVAGYVEDLAPYIARSRVMVVPLRSGSGMRVKILDALARSLPVVTTSIGAEGIEREHIDAWRSGDTPESFANQVVRVLTDDGEAERLREAGRALVKRHYDLPVIRSQLLERLRG